MNIGLKVLPSAKIAVALPPGSPFMQSELDSEGWKNPSEKKFFSTSPKFWTRLNTPPKRVFSTHTFPPENTPKNNIKKSDQFTKLNLSSSLDRANLNAYNPWEIVSRLQTIDPSPIWKRFYKRLSRSPRTPVFLPSSWRKSLLGNCRVNSARLQV